MKTYSARFKDVAGRRADDVALVHSGRGEPTTTTYGELASSVEKISGALPDLMGTSPYLPIFTGRTPAAVAAMLAALDAGRAFVFLNSKLKAPQVAHLLKRCGASVGVIDGPGAMTLRGAVEREPGLRNFPWLANHGEDPGGVFAKAFAMFTNVRPLETATGPSEADRESARSDVPGCCLFTSGSTGRPKGVVIAAADLLARAEAEIEWYGLDPEDVLLNVLPFSFDVGLNQLMSGLLAGSSVVLLESWLPADILAATERFGVTGISSVPSLWQDVLRSGMTFDTRHASLRYVTVSGGDLPEVDLLRMPDLVGGAGIFKTYGQTEAFRLTSLRPNEFAERPTSVGRPFAGSRVRVVDEDGRRCPPGVEGEVVHTGLGTMIGYLDDERTGDKLRPNPFRGPDDEAETAVYTGDSGYLDEDGYLFLKGRRDGMLKVQGNRVYPLEVAGQIRRLDGIEDVAVVGLKGGDGDTYLVAFVVTDAPGEERAWLRVMHRALPPYMTPRRVVELAGLPKTANGKIDIPALRREAEGLE